MEASGSLAAGMGSPTRMEATTFTAAITGTAATADGHGGKGKDHFLVTICNNFAIPTSCGSKIFLAPNIEPRPLSCGALRGRFAAASRGRSLLQPRFRLVAYPIGGLRLVLKLTDLFNRPIRPVDLDYPTLTVTKYRAENWLRGRHAHTG
jgi:hypothetical protein